jgi:hypothetical protein
LFYYRLHSTAVKAPALPKPSETETIEHIIIIIIFFFRRYSS